MAADAGPGVRDHAAGRAGIGRTATLLEQLAARPPSWTPVTASCTPAPGLCSISCPGGDVDHLLLYAPFHDEKAAAVGGSSNACGPAG